MSAFFEKDRTVTPCVGVWIEITELKAVIVVDKVTPCVGVWIEIQESLLEILQMFVTPCVGVWIEIYKVEGATTPQERHSLRGSVD